MATNYSCKASDWEAAGVLQMGAAEGYGAATFLFDFRSHWAGYQGQFLLTVAGAGLGGSLGGSTAPSFANKGLSYSTIPCKKSFSAEDLNYSPAHIYTVGVGAMLTYSLCYISAGVGGGALFHWADVGGWGFGGVSLGGINGFGVWKWISGKDNPKPVLKPLDKPRLPGDWGNAVSAGVG